MKTKLMALALLAGGSMFAQTRFSVGVQVGSGYGQGYYAPAPVYSARPPCPGPDFYWVDGYWSQNFGRRNWVAGYWNRRPYEERRYENRYERQYEGRYENRYDERRGSYDRYFDRDRDHDRGRDNNRYDNGFRNR